MPDLGSFQTDFIASLDGRAAAVTPLDVHRNTVLLGKIDALGDNFPVARALLGEQGFAGLAGAHGEAFPPVSPVMAHYGAAFPAWLAAHPIASELPYLADVAVCERLRIEALHAADAPALDLAAVQKLEIQTLLSAPLALHPATRFVWQETPAIVIWQAHQDGPPQEIALDWRATGALFTRPELSVDASEIDAATFRLLSGLGDGECLERALAAAAALDPEADIGSRFAGLVQRGAFTAAYRERSTP